ncbi:MAG: ATP-grasp domain-containing protein [bacterium]|nr:ATP-grasp domain-containing protein [bacterium]
MNPLLVVQPSDDYASRVRTHFPNAILLATPERAALLENHPHVIAADLGCLQDVDQAVRQYAQEQDIAFGGIVCFVCDYLVLTAKLARRLGLAFHAPQTVECTRYKDRMMSAWRAADVPTPPTHRIHRLEDLLAFTEAWQQPPWVLKPTDRSGSEWVLRVDRAKDLPEAHRKLTQGLAEPGKELTYIAQAFISGREFSADLFVDGNHLDILRLTEKYILPSQNVTGLVGAYYPSSPNAKVLEILRNTFCNGAQALGITRGIVMVDAILHKDTLYLLEMALRPGGDCLPDLCIHTTGYDPVHTACRVALGLSPEPVDLSQPNSVAALHLMTEQSGAVHTINFTRLQAHPQVLQFEPYRSPGDHIRCWEGSYDDRILASCLVRYNNTAELPDLIDTLSSQIDLELTSEDYALS